MKVRQLRGCDIDIFQSLAAAIRETQLQPTDCSTFYAPVYTGKCRAPRISLSGVEASINS